MIGSGDFAFSFSGLKTAVRYLLPKLGLAGLAEGERRQTLADVCASFQQAVVDVLVRKTLRAAREARRDRIVVSGGVSLNSGLRAAFAQACRERGVELLMASPALCTDNAAMIAFVAALAREAGIRTPVDSDIDPNQALPYSEAALTEG